VIKQYLELIGRPYLPPFWSLGFHNSRWGYESLSHVEEVVHNYSVAGIPLETQWVDIDYMDARKDFTVNERRFPIERFQRFVDRLHRKGQHFVPIVDPGIFAGDDQNYSPQSDGITMDIFIKDLFGSKPYIGQVWPGPTYFPDWFSENITTYWVKQFSAFYNKLPFDGIWIDMNEV
jgi:alpha-glucosidase (family GH31 glycosyl hydrolase)